MWSFKSDLNFPPPIFVSRSSIHGCFCSSECATIQLSLPGPGNAPLYWRRGSVNVPGSGVVPGGGGVNDPPVMDWAG